MCSLAFTVVADFSVYTFPKPTTDFRQTFSLSFLKSIRYVKYITFRRISVTRFGMKGVWVLLAFHPIWPKNWRIYHHIPSNLSASEELSPCPSSKELVLPALAYRQCAHAYDKKPSSFIKSFHRSYSMRSQSSVPAIHYRNVSLSKFTLRIILRRASSSFRSPFSTHFETFLTMYFTKFGAFSSK